jgi:uncharacterized protein
MKTKMLPLALVVSMVLGGCSDSPTGATTGPGACGDTADLISSIQGVQARSPRIGATVTIEAVVVGAHVEGLGGIFVQEEQADRDGDPMSSEGLFLQVDGANPRVSTGEVVRARGVVGELGEGTRTLTALVDLSDFRVCGRADELPLPALIEDAPLLPEDWEAFEGMRVEIEPAATVIGNWATLERGELLVALGGRQWVPTDRHPPGEAARNLAGDQARARILLDDGSIDGGVPERVAWLRQQPSGDAPLRAGSELRAIAGVLDQRLGSYRLHVDGRIEVSHAPRPQKPPEVSGSLRIASFNVQNYFNGDGKGGGFPTSRGARDGEELKRQRAKVISALRGLDADLYALSEIENDGYDRESAIAELARELGASRGRPRDYDYIRAPGERLGGDDISVGFIYRTRKLTPIGAAAALEDGPFSRGNRVPLAQTFEFKGSKGRFTAVVNHFKSKGGCEEADEANRDRGDGQGCWNAMRVEAARALAAWLATDPTGSGDPDVLILGDLNAYSREDPIRLLEDAGYALARSDSGRAAYSYVFGGQSGHLDHALMSASLASQFRDIAVWHINADEMTAFDFRRGNRPRAIDARMFRADPFRSSDHDPLLLGFDIDPPPPEPAPEAGDEAATEQAAPAG